MDNSLKKIDSPYLFALFLIFLTWVSFEIFKMGFKFGEHKANITKSIVIKSPA